MFFFRTLTAALFAVVASTPAFAETIEFVIENHSSQDVTGVFARPGEVSGFSAIRSSQTKTVTITLPAGECVATVTAVLSDRQQVSAGKADICTYNALQITN